MKLIDADRLVNETDDRYTLNEIGRRERDDIVNALEFAPTVDAVPVRHGKWSVPHGHPNARVCSVCMMICHEDSARFYKYCPNCGARMDG